MRHSRQAEDGPLPSKDYVLSERGRGLIVLFPDRKKPTDEIRYR